MQLHKN